MPSSVFFSRAGKLEYSMYLAGWGAETGETSSPLRALIGTFDTKAGMGQANRGRFSDSGVDALILTAMTNIDDTKRNLMLAAASRQGDRRTAGAGAGALRGVVLGHAQGRRLPGPRRPVHAGLRGERRPSDAGGSRVVTVFLLRRLAQTALVLFVTSLLVFFGLYVVGNPIEILVNPVADEVERARAAAALGLDKPILEQYVVFLRARCRATSAPASSTGSRRWR